MVTQGLHNQVSCRTIEHIDDHFIKIMLLRFALTNRCFVYMRAVGSVALNQAFSAMICISFKVVVYPASLFRVNSSCTSRTVLSPFCQSICKISNSLSVGLMSISVLRIFSYSNIYEEFRKCK